MINIDFKKQLPLNLISNIGNLALSVIVGIWMVPYLISHLGVEGYGFIPLASSVTAFIGLIVFALNNAVSRYLVIALYKNDNDGANRIFNTAFWSLAFVSVVLIPLFGLFSWMIPRIFNIPVYLTGQVQWLFLIMLLSFILSVFSSAFSVSTFALNRLDIRNLIDIGNTIIRTALIVLLFGFLSANLIGVGVAYLASGLMTLMLGYFFFRKLTPSIKISRQYFDSSRLRELTTMSGWLVVNQIGSLLFLQTDLIVANILFGAHEAGKYGALIQWSFLLRSLAGVISSVLIPVVFIRHAKGETHEVVSLSKRAVKLMGLGIAVPVGLLCGFATPLLTVWLGQDFAIFAPLLWVLIFHLVINLAVLPLFAIQNALNRVKIPGMVTLGMGAVNLFLAIILAKFCNLGLYGIATAGAIVLTIQNVFFTPIYTANILKLPYMIFVKPIGRGVLLAAWGMLVGQILSRIFAIHSWPQLFLSVSIWIVFSLGGLTLLLGRDRKVVCSLFRDALVAIKSLLRVYCLKCDATRWKNTDSLNSAWDSRTKQIASLVPPGSVVLEFGAGRMILRDYLPAGCKYTPSDIVDRGSGTIVCDLNLESLPDFPKVDVIVFSGVLEYINNLSKLITHLKDTAEIIIASYATLDLISDKIGRRRDGWVNDHSDIEIKKIFEDAGFYCEKINIWQWQYIYYFKKQITGGGNIS